MNQYTYTITDTFSIEDLISTVNRLPERAKGFRGLLLVFEPNDDRNYIRSELDALAIELPNIDVVGMTTLGPLSPGLMVPVNTVCSLIFFENSRYDVFAMEYGDEDIAETGKKLVEEMEKISELKVMLFMSSDSRKCPEPILTMLHNRFKDVPVTGAQAGSRQLNVDKSAVFFNKRIINHGILCVAFSGENLEAHVEYDLGFRQLGKDLTVTAVEDAYVKTINDMPAIDVYKKYLDVYPDEHFYENACAFPLLTRKDELLVAKVPLHFEGDKLLFSVAMKAGDKLTLSYSKSQYLLKETLDSANKMIEFQPDVLFLFSCINRIVFMGNEKAQREIGYFKNANSQMFGAYGFGEIVENSMGGGVLNSSIVSCGIREGGKKRAEQDPVVDQELIEKQSIVPLSNRLVTFLEVTTDDLRETIGKLEKLAELDQLTGIYNRRKLDEIIKYELGKRRKEKDLAIIMYDIDFFKSVNDTYGHDIGDVVIKELTKCVSRLIRTGDVIGRWGGEEFIVVVTDSNLNNAMLLADRIRRQVEKLEIDPVGHITISLGVTVAREGDDAESLFNRVDKALYEAKNSGRNRAAAQ